MNQVQPQRKSVDLSRKSNCPDIKVETLKGSIARFLLYYKFGLDEINTKVNILKQEFQHIHEYSPIEHVKWRLKTPESIVNKLNHKGYEWSFESIRENIRDIAGIRITCSFVSDIYRVAGMLLQQQDITVVEIKDYIESPKANGYQSLHMILQIPVFLSDRTEKVYVEVQIRTVGMDFWASLEHKIYYKCDNGIDVPQTLKNDLKNASDAIIQLDIKMERIHKEMQYLGLTKGSWGKERAPLTSSDITNEMSLDYLSMVLSSPHQ